MKKGINDGWSLVIDPVANLLKYELVASGNNWTGQMSIGPNDWHHVALTIKRTGVTATITLYVDGVALGSSVGMASSSNFASTDPLVIGEDWEIRTEIAIDEVEVFQHALTSQEVQAIFDTDTAGKCKPDLGDAPDSTNHAANTTMLAYLAPFVPANFPTVYAGSAPLGPIHWDAKGLAWLGADVSFEGEADVGWDQDGATNIQPALGIDQPALGIDGNDASNDGVTVVPLLDCSRTGLSTSFKFSATAVSVAQVYINVWFDWNRDGDWDDLCWCSGAGPNTIPVPEWAVQNYPVTLVPGFNDSSNNPAMVTPAFRANTPPLGQTIWMRITLTDVPVDANNNGGPFPNTPDLGKGGSGPVGGYCYGETEDYEVRP